MKDAEMFHARVLSSSLPTSNPSDRVRTRLTSLLGGISACALSAFLGICMPTARIHADQQGVNPDTASSGLRPDNRVSYTSGGKVRQLLRAEGELFVWTKRDEVKNVNVPGWAVKQLEEKTDLMLLTLRRLQGSSNNGIEPSATDDAIAALKATRGIVFITHAFTTAENQTPVLLTPETIVALKDGVDPEAHFAGRFKILRRQLGAHNQYIVSGLSDDFAGYLAELSKEDSNPDVLWASPNWRARLTTYTSPNDTLYPDQWNLKNTGQGSGIAGADIQAEDGWGWLTNPKIVAVLDTGVQLDHPDLKIAANSLELNGSAGVDDDGNGYVDDVYGVRFLNGGLYSANGSPDTGDIGHGTQVSGLIAARGNNSIGIAGVAYEIASVLPIGLGVSGGSQWSLDAAGISAAIYYAGGRALSGAIVPGWKGADVLNLSWGYPENAAVSAALDWVVTKGRGGRGCEVAVATGNNAARFVPVEMELPAGQHNIDFVAILPGGAIYLDDVEIPNYATQSFEGAQMPPLPWDSVNQVGWDPSFNNWARVTGNPKLVASGNAAAGATSPPGSDPAIIRTLRFKTPASNPGGVLKFKVMSLGLEQSPFRDHGFFVRLNNVHKWPLNDNGTVPFIPLGYPRATAPAVGEFGISYPATHARVLPVGASSEKDTTTAYSQGGTGLSIVAPVGELYWSYGMTRHGVPSTDRTGTAGWSPGDYTPVTGGLLGTSFAAPQVAAAAACLVSQDEERPLAEVRALLKAGCEKVGGEVYSGTDPVGGGWNENLGFGRLNLARSLDLGGWALLVTSPKFGFPWELGQNGTPDGRVKYLQKLGMFSIETKGYFTTFPNDSLTCMFESYNGNATLIARVLDVSGEEADSSAGLLVRGSLPSGTFAYVGLKRDGGVLFARRTGQFSSPTYSNAIPAAKPPYWLRLVTSSTTVTASASANGTTWTSVGSVTMAGFTNPKHIGATAVGGQNASSNPVRQGGLIDRISFTGPKIISTVAGSTAGYTSDGIASGSQFTTPSGLSYAPYLGYLIADTGNNRIRKLSDSDPSGWVYLEAGNGTAGYSGDGGAATVAQLNAPTDACWDEFGGGFYIADTGNHCVRKVTQGGIITTFAGIGGTAGYSGDGGAATSANLSSPTGVAVDRDGRVYIADKGNNRIRMVDSATGTISTVVGGGAFLGDGGLATLAKLVNPADVAVDLAGNLFVADTGQFRIRRVDALHGTIETVVGTGVAGYTGNGGAGTNAKIGTVNGLSVDLAGNVFFSDILNASNHYIRKLAEPTGLVSRVGGVGTAGFNGDGGISTSARVNEPHGITVDSGGRVVFSDSGNNRIRTIY